MSIQEFLASVESRALSQSLNSLLLFLTHFKSSPFIGSYAKIGQGSQDFKVDRTLLVLIPELITGLIADSRSQIS